MCVVDPVFVVRALAVAPGWIVAGDGRRMCCPGVGQDGPAGAFLGPGKARGVPPIVSEALRPFYGLGCYNLELGSGLK